MKLSYKKHRIENLINITKIISIHYYEFDKNFYFDGESHNFWEIVYVDAGNVHIKTNDNEFYLKQGDILFHKPNEFHTLKTDKGSAANVFVITFFCSSEAMSFFREKSMALPGKLKKYISSITEEYLQAFNPMAVEDTELRAKEDAPIGSLQMIKTYLEQFLISLIRNDTANNNLRTFPSKESSENHIISRIIEIIEENTYSKITVEDICEKLSYSRTYLSKIFKTATGYTILEYILKLKIREAKKLIREENYNFTQISNLLAFDNPHYFSTVFKKIANMTPTDYKNSAKTP